MNVFDLVARILLDTSEYDNDLDNASNRFQKFGKALSATGSTLTKAATLPIVGLGTAIIKTGADYEAGMSKVQAISGATADEISMLGDEAMRMAEQTKFSTAESAEAYQYMAMAGWDAHQMVDGLSGIMLLAAASGEDLATTSDIVTDALTAFGLKAEDSGRFADVLAAASNSANTNVALMGESFKYVAPVAGAFGYSIEDVSVALGLMANAGVKGSMSGTALRSALTSLLSPTKDAAIVMENYGLSMENTDGSSKNLMEIMQMLRMAFGDMGIEVTHADGELKEYSEIMSDVAAATGEGSSELDNLAAISTLFGERALPGMLAIIQSAPEDFDKLTAAIYDSSGTTQEMADIMNDNAAGAMAMLSSAINVLFTNLSQFLIPAFTDIVRKITGVVNWFNSLDEGTHKLILTIAGVAAAVGPVLIVVGKVITAIGTIGSAIGGIISAVQNVGAAVSGLFSILAANPIGLVIASVAALVAGLVVLWNTNEGFRNAVKGIWETITGFFQAAAENIQAAWNGVVEFFSGVWDAISSAFSSVTEFFGGVFSSAWGAVQSAWAGASAFFAGIWAAISGAFSAAVEVIGGFFSAAWDAVQGAWSAAGEFFSGVWDGITGVFGGVADFFGRLFSAAWEAVASAWGAAVDFFSGIWTAIQSAFEAVTETLGGFFTEAWEAVRSAWGAAGEFFSAIWSGISGTFSGVAQFFGGLFTQAWEAITGAWGGVTTFFSGVWESITGVFSGVWEKFKNIGSNIVNGIKDGIAGAWSALTGWFSEKISGLVDGVKGLLGIHSRSTVFAGIGGNMALGLADGWVEQYSGVKRQIERGLDFGNAAVGLSANGAGAWAGNGQQAGYQQPVTRGGDTYNFYSPKALDPVSAAREMKKAKQQMAMGYVGG